MLTLCLMVGMATVGVAEDDQRGRLPGDAPGAGSGSQRRDQRQRFPRRDQRRGKHARSQLHHLLLHQRPAGRSVRWASPRRCLPTCRSRSRCLKSIFSAQLPALDVITPPETVDEYIGFLPIYRENRRRRRYVPDRRAVPRHQAHRADDRRRIIKPCPGRTARSTP